MQTKIFLGFLPWNGLKNAHYDTNLGLFVFDTIKKALLFGFDWF